MPEPLPNPYVQSNNDRNLPRNFPRVPTMNLPRLIKALRTRADHRRETASHDTVALALDEVAAALETELGAALADAQKNPLNPMQSMCGLGKP